MKQRIHNGGCQICECLCVGGEVTGETCDVALLSGFYNESNVTGPYKATIAAACFFFLLQIYKAICDDLAGHCFAFVGMSFSVVF